MNSLQKLAFGQTGVVTAVSAAAALCAFVFAAPVLAFDPFDPPTGRSCIDCHGRESSEASNTVAETRKGPHGNYASNTRKCGTCHGPHSATGAFMLLPGTEIRETCESCHDGTGGKGVYGVVEARTGDEPQSMHGIETTDTIPHGAVGGGPRTGDFYGPGNTMTCIDCHSPHDSDTVAPFTGDRLRAPTDDEVATAADVPTNRLLRRLVGEDGVPVERYGSDWCAACHRGYHLASADDDPDDRHPVAFEAGGDWHYDRVRIVTDTNTTSTEWGSLGGSNRGYVMPHEPGQPTTHLGAQLGVGPICQQCHEDARDVGGVLAGSPVLLPGQEFSVTFYPDGSPEPDPADNPRFQVFPHESDQPAFRVTRSDPYQPPLDGFCMRCHVW